MGKHVWRGEVFTSTDDSIGDNVLPRAEHRDDGPEPKQRRGAGFLFYLVLALLGSGLAFGGVWLTLQRTGAMAPIPEPVNVLVLGVDERSEDAGRSDTIMVVAFNPAAKMARVVSIPRDTRVQMPGHTWHDKINAAYGIGGPDLSRRTVENLLGIRIDYYVMVNFEGFKQAVDSLGGVELDIADAMDYEDRAQDLKIHLKPGRQRLSGQEALGYVRYRSDGLGDISLTDPANQVYEGRVRRQQRFVMALATQALEPKNVWRLPAVAKALFGAVDTNMPVGKIVEYARAARRMTVGQVATELLPGLGDTIGGVSYWVPDDRGLASLAQRIQAVPEAPPAKPERAVGKLALPVLKFASEQPEKAEGRVAVLNGSGTPGLAKKVGDLLTEQGFTVVSVGNADRFDYQTSKLYGVEIKRAVVKAAEKVLGQLDAEERSQDQSDVDFTIVIGQSYQQ